MTKHANSAEARVNAFHPGERAGMSSGGDGAVCGAVCCGCDDDGDDGGVGVGRAGVGDRLTVAVAVAAP